MTNLLLPDRDPNIVKKEIHVFLPLVVVLEMDMLRRKHKEYLWGNTRSYYVEMALKWFANFLQEGEANDQEKSEAGVQKASSR